MTASSRSIVAVGAAAAGLALAGCAWIGLGVALQGNGSDDDPAPAGSGAGTPPSVNVADPMGPQSLTVPLGYVLIDAESQPADLAVTWQISLNGGATWSVPAPATERAGAPSEGVGGLAASPSGVSHVFVWDAFADVGGVNALARLTLTPSAPGPPPQAGTPGSTSAAGFTLLNDVIVAIVGGGGGGVLNFPGAVARDGSGNLYVADTFHHRVRVLNTQASAITVGGVTVASNQLGVLAGTGVAGFNGDNQPASMAQLNFPSGVALDGSGHVFVADSLNHRIRRIDRLTGYVTTVAGTGTAGTAGDNTLATQADLDTPRGCAFDGAGNLHVADTGNHAVRVVNYQTGQIWVPATSGVSVLPGRMRYWAGNPGNASGAGDGGLATAPNEFDLPWSVAFDGNGQCYVADSGNDCIRVVNMGTTSVTVAGVTIAAGTVATVVGTNGGTGFAGDGGAANAARLDDPRGVALDGNGNIVVADRNNSRLRAVNTGTSSITLAGVTIASNAIDTVAGGGTPASGVGDGGAATSARLAQPEGLVMLAGGHAALADTGNALLRVVNTGATTITVAGVSIAAGNIDRVAGTTGGAAGLLRRPAGLARVGSLLFYADTDDHRVWQRDLATGATAVVAGTGVPGFAGDGGAATSAQLKQPRGLAVDGNGNLYIADFGNLRVRVVNRGSATTTICNVSVPAGAIATIAGSGATGTGGDGGAATAAALGSATEGAPGVAVDGNGHCFIAHAGGHRIRRVDASSGVITTVAGTGAAGFIDGAATATARFDRPRGVFVDGAGNLLVADRNNDAVRYVNLSASSVTVANVVVAAGAVGTVAGTGTAGYNGDNQAATSAQCNAPESVARLAGGDLLVVDTGNARIRRVNSGTGLITTVGGTGVTGDNGDLLPPVNAHLNGPTHLVLDGATPANAYLADAGNRRIRRFTP